MEIVDILYKINRFWRTQKMPTSFLYNVIRSEFDEIVEKLNNRRILSIIGPRRVGKSTLLFQTMDYLLKNNINPFNILFFSGDEPSLFTNKNTITDIIEIYSSQVLKKDLEDVEDTIYVFIDEIHLIENWQLHIKSYYDRRYKIKFIISGSSMTHLFKNSNESLFGRIEDIYIQPLSLKQFIDFYSIYKDKTLNLNELNKLMPKKSLYFNIDKYYNELQENIEKITPYKDKMDKIIQEYLLIGGYPEYFENDIDILKWQKNLVDDIIQRGLYRDIINIYNIKSGDILEKLMYFIASNSGQEYAYNTIAQTLGIDTITVTNYISYLSQVFFIGVSNNYTENIGKSIRKNKKLYILDSGIKNALLKIDEPTPTDIGLLIENDCVRQAIAFANKNNSKVWFWRDNGKEVDIIFDDNISLVPIEVKYRTEVKKTDLKGIESFSNKYKVKNKLVITRNLLNKKDDIYYIPYWLIR